MLIGILFTILWASGAVSVKFGLLSSPPLTMGIARFLLAGTLILLYIHLFKKGKYRLPRQEEWKQLLLLGLFNTTLYLGCGFIALQSVSSGFFNLAVVINPLLVAVLSSLLTKKIVHRKVWIGMFVAAIGIFIATIPQFDNSHSTLGGLLLLLTGIISMAIGSVYFQKVNLQLPSLVINAWQVLFGGILLIIPAIILEWDKPLIVDLNFILYIAWSVFGISILGMMLWFYLLKQDAVKANIWMFLTPIAGYALAAVLLGEKITFFEITATIFVFAGLYLTGNLHFNRSKAVEV